MSDDAPDEFRTSKKVGPTITTGASSGDLASPSTRSNPYASPISEAAPSATSSYVRCDFGVIIRRWEKLRLYYNGILVAIVMLSSLILCPGNLLEFDYLFAMVFGAIVSNLCFFAGPLLEGYGTYLRLWNPILSYAAFVIGLGFTALAAIVSVYIYSAPN